MLLQTIRGEVTGTKDEDKPKEALKKLLEALSKTPLGEDALARLKAAAEKDPVFKAISAFFKTPWGIGIAAALGSGAMGAAIATKPTVSISSPEIPLGDYAKGTVSFKGDHDKQTFEALGGISVPIGPDFLPAKVPELPPSKATNSMLDTVDASIQRAREAAEARSQPGVAMPPNPLLFSAKPPDVDRYITKFGSMGSMRPPVAEPELPFRLGPSLNPLQPIPGLIPPPMIPGPGRLQLVLPPDLMSPLPWLVAPAAAGQHNDAKKKREEIQRKATSDTPSQAPAQVHKVTRTSGQPLDPTTRNFMESRLGHDFSCVRIHADTQADTTARQLSAEAYTLGEHIAFASGRYAPQTVSGRRLLAHELVHVIQQR